MNNNTVKAHLFQVCQGQGSVLCMVRSARTSQTNWPLWLKHTWAWYGCAGVIASKEL